MGKYVKTFESYNKKEVQVYNDGNDINYKIECEEGEAYADVRIVSDDERYLSMIESEFLGGGTILMDYLINDAIKNGVKKISLHCSLYNKEDFFVKFGFVEDKNSYDEDESLYYMYKIL